MPTAFCATIPPNTMPLQNSRFFADFAAALRDREAPLPSPVARAENEPTRDGFSVHRNGVQTGLTGALAAIYPTLQRLIGHENFAALAAQYIPRYPPTSPVLHEYGAHFATHLASEPQLAHLPFLPDVALVERAWLDAWHAPDADALSATALTALAPEALMRKTLSPHPAARLLRLGSSAATLVRLDRAGGDLTGLDPLPPQAALITRPEVTVRIEVLTEGQSAFLAALLSGKTLGDAAEAGLTAEPQMDLPAAMALMIASGAFRDEA